MSEDQQVDYWTPPKYNLEKSPSKCGSLKLNEEREFLENFGRTARWSPDGSTLLTQCENRTFQLFETPLHPDNGNISYRCTDAPRVFEQPAPILESLWYPTAAAANPASFCFLASVRENPVKLLDASDGRLRASYRIVDHRERQIAPHSLAFNLTAEKIYCGFEDAVEVFDVNRPGEGTRLPTTPSKKSKDGLKGIVSALSFSPSYGSDIFYAAGTLSPIPSNIAIFNEAAGAEPVRFVDGGPHAGVTQIRFNPTKPHIMYASFRRCGDIYSWDLRANADFPVNIYQTASIPTTNQRTTFDIDISGSLLAVGDQQGKISIFDLESSTDASVNTTTTESYSDQGFAKLTFNAHNDSIGSVAFHPFQPVMMSVSGSRHFDRKDMSESESSSDEDTTQPRNLTRQHITRLKKKPQPFPVDCSISMWSFL